MPTSYRLILLISMSLLSNISVAATNPTAYVAPAANSPALTRSPLLEPNIVAAQTIQLSSEAAQLITLSTAREHFSALFLPANHAEPRGMLILLPGVGETFDWPIAIGPLRSKLPDAGWHTLSLNLPPPPSAEPATLPIIAAPVAEQIIIEPPAPAVPAKADIGSDEDTPETDTTEADPETEPDEVEPAEENTSDISDDESPAELEPTVIAALPPLTYPERISSFIEAAIEYAQQAQAREIILLGHHEGAYWALNYVMTQPTTSPVRVVLIAPRDNQFEHSTYESLIKANTPTLADFYYKGDRVTEAAAKQRLQASKRAGLTHYHQVGLTAAHPSLAQEQLFRRVKGWLNKQ